MRAPLRGARTSARLALLADKLLASLAQFTRRQAPSVHRSRCLLIQHFRETLLAQNHTRRQAPSAHRSCCSLIQRFQETLLAQNHTCRQAPSAHRSRCSLIQRKVAMTYPEPSTKVSAKSAQTAEKKHLLHSSNAPCWAIRAPPGGNGTHDIPNHPPKFQPNRPTDS